MDKKSDIVNFNDSKAVIMKSIKISFVNFLDSKNKLTDNYGIILNDGNKEYKLRDEKLLNNLLPYFEELLIQEVESGQLNS